MNKISSMNTIRRIKKLINDADKSKDASKKTDYLIEAVKLLTESASDKIK